MDTHRSSDSQSINALHTVIWEASKISVGVTKLANPGAGMLIAEDNSTAQKNAMLEASAAITVIMVVVASGPFRFTMAEDLMAKPSEVGQVGE